MKQIALLRGVNAGTLRRIGMNELKDLFRHLGYDRVFTYQNSGNVIFESDGDPLLIRKEIEHGLERKLGLSVPALVMPTAEMKSIAQAIPLEWQNDSVERTDVAFLFEEIDSENILDDLPVKRAFIEIHYVKGAVFWNLKRVNLNKSQLSKIISHPFYKWMTLRNLNTVRYLSALQD
jgi:uncharacterized protein (DUF1697 family)